MTAALQFEPPSLLWAVRIGAIVAGLAIWHLTQKMLARRVPVAAAPGGGLPDTVHRWTARWHQALHDHPRRADRLLVASSLVIDLLGIWLLVNSIAGPSFGPFLGLILIFALRQVVQALCPLPAPPGMIWRKPGFPTLLVTYDTDNDLFFSGHTALAVYGALCLAAAFGPVGVALGFVIVTFEILVVLALRAHYTMDVFAGALAALWLHDLTQRIAPTVDAWLARLVL